MQATAVAVLLREFGWRDQLTIPKKWVRFGLNEQLACGRVPMLGRKVQGRVVCPVGEEGGDANVE